MLAPNIDLIFFNFIRIYFAFSCFIPEELDRKYRYFNSYHKAIRKLELKLTNQRRVTEKF